MSPEELDRVLPPARDTGNGRPSPLARERAVRAQQLAAAKRIAAEPELHCEGLVRWAALVLHNESEVSQ